MFHVTILTGDADANKVESPIKPATTSIRIEIGREDMLDPRDYAYFTDRAFDGMAAIVADLGDDLASRRPALTGANSPYALLTHCLGVVSYWAGHLVAGRPVERDRDAEFTATGPVAPLLAQIPGVKAQLAADAEGADPSAPLRKTPPSDFRGPNRPLNQGAALQHVFEELAQHHGQMELIRDVIVAESTGELQVRQ